MSDDVRAENDMDNTSMGSDEADDQEPIEGYCMSCRQKVEIEDPQPVWTSQGRPGTRGTCPECGGSVYRMGHTPAHDDLKRPEAIQVVDKTGIKRSSKAAKIKVEAATYVVGTPDDSALLEQLAQDLDKVGIATWVDKGQRHEDVNWAGGVHPALDQCKKMVVVLSQKALASEDVRQAWQYFLTERKPIIVALAEDVEPPDELRTKPRYDLFSDYKTGFRRLWPALSNA